MQTIQTGPTNFEVKILKIVDKVMKDKNWQISMQSLLPKVEETCSKEEWTKLNNTGGILGLLKRYSGRYHDYLIINVAGSVTVRVLEPVSTPKIPMTLEQRGDLMKVVEDPVACLKICKDLAEENVIALDCEGVDLGNLRMENYGLCLVSISANCGTFIFDIYKEPRLFDAGGLRELLENPNQLISIHDCRCDVKALASLNVHLKSVFDTQIAYSCVNSVGSGNTIRGAVSLQNMVYEVLGRSAATTHTEKKDAPHLHDREAWRRRPLSAQSLSYARQDVVLLYEATKALFGLVDGVSVMNKVRSLSNARVAEYERSIATSTGRWRSNDNTNISAAEFDLNSAVSSYLVAAENTATSNTGRFDITVDVDLFALEEVLPEHIRDDMHNNVTDPENTLVDVVMDLDRPMVYIVANTNGFSASIRSEYCMVTEDDLNAVLEGCGPVTDSHRACVGDSLHRCSVICDPVSGETIGLTLRLARIVKGIAGAFQNILDEKDIKSILLIGPPGQGKTTIVRDLARCLSSEAYDRRVMVVDTNNEIAGEQTVPHPAIGNSRRMKAGRRANQFETMLEAVQNHTPETLVIDEIGTVQEVNAAVGIRQRGVQLIATTHGSSLKDIIQNPQTRNLLGGVNVVILSAMEKFNEKAPSKTRLERKLPASFDVCVELLGHYKWRIHRNVAETVDAVLRNLGESVTCEIRELDPVDGSLSVDYGVYPLPEDVPDIRVDMNDMVSGRV